MLDTLKCALLALSMLVFLVTYILNQRKLAHIPTVGHSWPLLSYLSAFRFPGAAREIIEEGYAKYPNQVWKLPTMDGWLVVANGTKFVQEIGKASDDQLSAGLSFESLMQLEYTLGHAVTQNPYHETVVRTSMTRNIANQYEDLRNEMLRSFDDEIPVSPGDWMVIPALQTVVEIMSRVSTTLAVGRSLSDNKEFRDICLRSGKRLWSGKKLRRFPRFLRPLASRLFIGVHSDLEKMGELLKPFIMDRVNGEENQKSNYDRPNNLLTWLLDEAVRAGEERAPTNIAARIYFLAFASDLSSKAFLCALYELASRKEYIRPLREEVKNIVDQEGWSKESIAKMYKLDSFLRETHRAYDRQLLHLSRKVLKDFTLSDGTLIPAETTIFVNSWGIHHDESFFPSAHEFKGFRFVTRDGDQQPLFAKPAVDYTAFGYGRHACPGRFFAATLLKTMLAHVILAYDVEIAEGASQKVQSSVLPDANLRLAFRKR